MELLASDYTNLTILAIMVLSIVFVSRMIKKGVYNEDTRSLMNFLFLIAGGSAILLILFSVADIIHVLN